MFDSIFILMGHILVFHNILILVFHEIVKHEGYLTVKLTMKMENRINTIMK